MEKENTLEKPKIFYAECPNEKDGSFNIDENSEMEIPDISVFKFTQTGPDTAEFELINNPNVIQRAIKLYYTLLQPVTENKTGYDQNATPADLIFEKAKGTVKKEGGKWILVDKLIVKKMGKNSNPFSQEKIIPEVKNVTESVAEVKGEHNKDLEKQKKIAEIYSEIMEMIKRNTESLLREQKLEEELAQLIASDTKKEVASEPAGKIEIKPFSFNIEFIKNKIPEILKSIKEIEEILELSISGSKNELILNAKIKAHYIFDVKIDLKNVHIINNKNTVEIDKNSFSVKTDTWGTEGQVKKLIASNIDMLGEKIKEIIEKEVNKKVEKVWIENGELKAL